MPQWRVRNGYQPRKWRDQLENKKKRSRCRDYADKKRRDHNRIGCNEQTETCKDDGQPEYQQHQEGQRNGIVRLRIKQQAGLGQVRDRRDDACLKTTLSFGLWVQRFDSAKETLCFGAHGEGRFRRRCQIALAPYFVCERSDTPAQQLPERISFGAILSEELIDNDDVDGQLSDLVGLRIIRNFC